MQGNRSEVTGNKADELKPCPFCGGAAERCQTMNCSYVKCSNKGCEAVVGAFTQRAADHGWNRRVTSERVEFAEIIVRLKQRGVITEADAARLAEAEVAYGG